MGSSPVAPFALSSALSTLSLYVWPGTHETFIACPCRKVRSLSMKYFDIPWLESGFAATIEVTSDIL